MKYSSTRRVGASTAILGSEQNWLSGFDAEKIYPLQGCDRAKLNQDARAIIGVHQETESVSSIWFLRERDSPAAITLIAGRPLTGHLFSHMPHPTHFFRST